MQKDSKSTAKKPTEKASSSKNQFPKETPNMQPLTVLGGLTAARFLTDYWQKKPLLVRLAMPQVVGLFEPQDIKELALQEEVNARLITQKGEHNDPWQLKTSPLTPKDFKKLPEKWTLLVQAVDHWSIELAELWQQFNFIPQWRRDDIMISYAPKGGSVGQHVDQYDVFLVQAHGSRHWQLGQKFAPDAAILPNQPLRLLDNMGDIVFDEILQPGDLLYVPPGLSHYGVAQNDCLTCSFGFRMPTPALLFDKLTDQLSQWPKSQIPIAERSSLTPALSSGAVKFSDIEHLRGILLATLTDSEPLTGAMLALLSEPKFDTQAEPEPWTSKAWQKALEYGVRVRLDPAARLLYLATDNATPSRFWFNGEPFPAELEVLPLLQQLADGHWLETQQLAALDSKIVLNWFKQGLIITNEPDIQ